MKNTKLDLNALFTEIKKHKTKINKGKPYWPDFAAYLSEKYMKPLDKKWGKRTSNGPDPYTDVLHEAMAACGIILD